MPGSVASATHCIIISLCNIHTFIIWPIVNTKHINGPKFFFVAFVITMRDNYRYEHYTRYDILLLVSPTYNPLLLQSSAPYKHQSRARMEN